MSARPPGRVRFAASLTRSTSMPSRRRSPTIRRDPARRSRLGDEGGPGQYRARMRILGARTAVERAASRHPRGTSRPRSATPTSAAWCADRRNGPAGNGGDRFHRDRGDDQRLALLRESRRSGDTNPRTPRALRPAHPSRPRAQSRIRRSATAPPAGVSIASAPIPWRTALRGPLCKRRPATASSLGCGPGSSAISTVRRRTIVRAHDRCPRPRARRRQR